MKSFGEKLKTQREKEGKALRTLAEEVAVGKDVLSRIERGGMPDIESFAKLCAWRKIDFKTGLVELGISTNGAKT